ncbi:hypothetical protein IQ266_09935 [filamentous cyanobacterium LEGE 11480]|uniref:Uncharacterized protein n=1 Tax=Romeriopsis navalis LEGE 11480 TaxID=2777977 RepID=A0A928Z255_9CYAN|nr:hypothetical protein [Romeriopsis navalis]MBE9030046.1 hypothetical protein [Romeriopsis navalis LEGE 11480]
MSLPEKAQLAHNAAHILIEEALSSQENPLEAISNSMTKEEFRVFCKLLSFECQKLVDRQISIWETSSTQKNPR